MFMLLFPRTVRGRLTLWNTLVLALILFVLVGALRMVEAQSLMNSVDMDLKGRAKRAQEVAGFFAQFLKPSGIPEFPKRGKMGVSGQSAEFPRPEDTGVPSQWQTRVVEKWFDAKGKRVGGPGDDPPLDPVALSQAEKGTESYSTVRIAGEPVRVFSAPATRLWQVIPGAVVQEGYSLIDVERAQANMDRALLMLIPVGLAAAGAGGLFLTGRMLRPVREVTQAAALISAADLSQRLPVEGRDEFSVLAATLNGMLSRLEMSFEQQKRFTADASHELRTPLTVIKSATSRALLREDLPEDQKRVMERIDRAAGLMGSVIQDLLLLARSDAGQLDLQFQPVSLHRVIEEALAYTVTEGSPLVRNQIGEAVIVRGDWSHLVRIFANLVSNAVRHTPSTGSITLSARGEGSHVVVTVADTGEGIAPEHLPHVMERFYRMDAARTRMHGGTGLGLAICQSIARAHGGDLKVRSTPGNGTSISILLPKMPEIDEELKQ